MGRRDRDRRRGGRDADAKRAGADEDVRGDADRSIALPNSRLKAAKTSERSVAQYGTIECESIGACSSTGAMKPLAPYTNMP